MLRCQLDEQVIVGIELNIRNGVDAEFGGADTGLLVDRGQVAADQGLVRLVDRIGDRANQDLGAGGELDPALTVDIQFRLLGDGEGHDVPLR
ncbi:hypothetical protein D3C76_943050 [compost metagenome]